MRRRDFIGLVGGTVASWPLRVCALRAGLRQLGYVEGKNIVIEFRWAERMEQLPELAAELVHMNVDVIFAPSSTQVEAARQATKTIPIVFANHADPVGVGHVASLTQPGGNITGLSVLLTDLVVKQLEILKELVPQATRIGVLFSPTTPSHRPALLALETASQSLGFRLQLVPVRAAEDFDAFPGHHSECLVGGCLVVTAPISFSQRARVAELALKYRLPAMFGGREHIEVGGLISYYSDLNDLARRAAVYIDKILKGAKPADLPVEQASKYELVINRSVGGIVRPSALAVMRRAR